MNYHRLPLSFTVLALAACGNTGTPARSYGPLLNDLGEQVVLPAHREFTARAAALVAASDTLSASPSSDSLEGAQGAWRAARAAFRALDSVHIGPGITLGITERIDIASSVQGSAADAAGIEALVSSSGALDPAAVSALGGRKKGFLGLEYLLFPDPATTSPAPALAGDEGATRRRAFVQGMAGEIAHAAQQLDDAWEVDRGGYVTQLELAGRGGAHYATQRAAVDDLVGGVSYALELVVGIRLALPLGLKAGGIPDPLQDPTLRSDNAAADLSATLNGVSAVYAGGFNTVIAAANPELDRTLTRELADALAKCQAIPAPFASGLDGDMAPVRAAYDACKLLKTTWNTQAASALGATLKVGDNDGD